MQAVSSVTEVAEETEGLGETHQVLMARVAESHDREAFKALFVFYGPRVKALMLKAGAEHHVADDITQEVMMAVWRKVHLYAPERGTVAAWIYTIARNARIDRLRRRSAQAYRDVDEMDIVSGDANSEEEVFAAQRAERVEAALRDLPDDQRRIIELAYIHDLPQSEIASELDLPLGTVKSRMRLAYQKLKGKLEELK